MSYNYDHEKYIFFSDLDIEALKRMWGVEKKIKNFFKIKTNSLQLVHLIKGKNIKNGVNRFYVGFT